MYYREGLRALGEGLTESAVSRIRRAESLGLRAERREEINLDPSLSP